MTTPVTVDSNIIIYSMMPDYRFLQSILAECSVSASAVTKVEVLGYGQLSPLDRQAFVDYFQTITLYDTNPEIIEKATQLRQQKKMSLGDAIIAGTSCVYKLPLMTRNIADFEWISGLEVINPFGIS